MIRLAGLALLLTAASVAAAEPPLRALRWFGPEVDRVAVLTRAPGECLAGTSPAIEIGRAAFRSPLLLGGQAARAGLACESCHRNGRGNPHFRFEGVSGAAGTADVTSSLFSRRRGDGTDNPRPIPDLGLAPRRVPPGELGGFIAGLVTEEFDGAAPPPAVLAGLVAYVNALQPAACPVGDTAITAAGVAGDARRAVAAAATALGTGDRATATAMLLAARGQLGLLAERYAGMAREARLLHDADRALAAALEAVRHGGSLAPVAVSAPGVSVALGAWQAAASEWTKLLVASEGRSLFAAERLAKRRRAS